MTAWLIDILAVVIIALGVKSGAKRGLVRTVWRVAAWLLTIILVSVLMKPVSGYISQTSWANALYEGINTSISEKIGTVNLTDTETDVDEEISKATGIPQLIVSNLDLTEAENGINSTLQGAENAVARSAAELVIKFIAGLALFIIIRILLAILFRFLNGLSRLPLIHGVNRFLGGVLGFVNIMFIIYIVCALLYFIVSAKPELYEMINSTYLVKYFYNNNILLRVFIRF